MIEIFHFVTTVIGCFASYGIAQRVDLFEVSHQNVVASLENLNGQN